MGYMMTSQQYIVTGETTTDGINIVADAITTADAMDISADALTTGAALRVVSDSSSTGTRDVVLFHNDNTAATGATVVNIKNDSTGTCLKSEGPVLIDSAVRTTATTVNFDHLKIGNTNAVTIPSGTTALVTGLHVAIPNWTATGTITTAASLYVAGAATEGGTDYALWIDAGKAQFDGEVEIDGALNHDGSTVGFFSVTPAAQQAHNVSTVAALGSLTFADATTNPSVIDATELQEAIDLLGAAIETNNALLETFGLRATS